MYLNYKQADNKLFSISLYELDYIINKIKVTYSNAIFITEIKKDLSCFLIIYTRFINIFSKIVLDKFLLYRPYDYKIALESDKKELIYIPLYKINAEEPEITKKYLLENLDKSFIKASQVPSSVKNETCQPYVNGAKSLPIAPIVPTTQVKNFGTDRSCRSAN
jgi:hypothetical protein